MDNTPYTNMKESLENELESLRQTREELRLQASLACADVKKDWDQLETRFRLAQEELTRVSAHTKAAAHEAGERARAIMAELKAGYQRIRSAA